MKICETVIHFSIILKNVGYKKCGALKNISQILIFQILFLVFFIGNTIIEQIIDMIQCSLLVLFLLDQKHLLQGDTFKYFLDPAGTKAPTFPSEDLSRTISRRTSHDFALLCIAQGYPVPETRYVCLLVHFQTFMFPFRSCWF